MDCLLLATNNRILLNGDCRGLLEWITNISHCVLKNFPFINHFFILFNNILEFQYEKGSMIKINIKH